MPLRFLSYVTPSWKKKLLREEIDEGCCQFESVDWSCHTNDNISVQKRPINVVKSEDLDQGQYSSLEERFQLSRTSIQTQSKPPRDQYDLSTQHHTNLGVEKSP